MLELSLFTGAGGGVIASRMLGWRTIGYVENDDHCQRSLRARIDDGSIDDAPIFGDLDAFVDRGFARRYRDVADVVTAGFPCQPWSAAGKRDGELDERNLWPELVRTLAIVGSPWVFLENVPTLLSGSHGYFGRILRDLAELRYDARWGVLSAEDVGARHRRKRLWIVAHADGE